MNAEIKLDFLTQYQAEKKRIANLEAEEKAKVEKELGELLPFVEYSHDNNLCETYTFRLSKEPKESWPFGIFLNADAVIFMVHNGEMKLENIMNHTKNGIKFRASKVKNFDDMLQKVKKFVIDWKA